MSWLVRRFGPRIHVDGSRDRFVWRWREREVVLEPVLYLDPARRLILGVSEPPAVLSIAAPAFDDPPLLDKFIKFGFERILGRRLTIRPHVRIAGLARLSAGDAAVVGTALRRAGAGWVEVGE